jgi:non-ribosomal peptide synthetase component E (peptide arylation enzyme)
MNLLDDSLSTDLARDGRLSDAMTERFLKLGRYVIFDDGISPAEARRRVSDRMARVQADLPDLARPELAPDAPALRCGSVEWSFAELDRVARRAANALRAQGLRTGDRLAIRLPNGAYFVALVHAAQLCGAARSAEHAAHRARARIPAA